VLAISGQEHDAALAAEGATVFAENCAACHTDAGKGDRTQGAPNLTDAIWLYGGTAADLTYTVTNARFGVMPNWNQRLSEADIRSVALYVHGLGGGE
jgi:cytochrome c oxidase cbb3-type subunit 3